MHKEILKYYFKYNIQQIPQKSKVSISKDRLINIFQETLNNNEDFYMSEKFLSRYVNEIKYNKLMPIFYKALKINQPDNYNNIKDIQNRRNALIHSNIIIDFKHKKVNEQYIDSDYLNFTLEEYEKYLNSLTRQISTHYSENTKLNALKNLWYYTFSTPLCAKFEDWWVIREEEDNIFAYKGNPLYNNLSSSEKFMLDIWRGQLTNYKVGFLNMSSLDDHTQNCLYMFLKLSNDIFMY